MEAKVKQTATLAVWLTELTAMSLALAELSFSIS